METNLPTELLEALRRDAGGSALILTGGGNLTAAAQAAAAAMECENHAQAPCGHCGHCRKVLAGIHPDVVTAADSEHKMISVEVLRTLRADAYILPNEGRRKIFIFPDCALLDQGAQNVLLKVVEEGPEHAAFLFCAKSAGVLLPTLRSRCAQWRVGGDAEAVAAEDPRTGELCRLLAGRDHLGLAAFFTALETARCSREDLQTILEQTWQRVAQALLLASGCAAEPAGEEVQALSQGLSRPALSAAADLLREQAQQLRFNLNVGHTAGAMSAALGTLLRQEGRSGGYRR